MNWSMVSMVCLFAANTVLTAEKHTGTNSATFTKRYIKVHVPEGKCAHIKLVPKNGIQKNSILIRAVAINPDKVNNRLELRGSVSLVKFPIIARADYKNEYRIIAYRVDPITNPPVAILSPQDIFEEPEITLVSCNTVTSNDESMEFAPLFMTDKQMLSSRAKKLIIAGAITLSMAVLGMLGMSLYREYQKQDIQNIKDFKQHLCENLSPMSSGFISSKPNHDPVLHISGN